MSNPQHRINNTSINNLATNLRGEIGEIIFSWTLMRSLKISAQLQTTGDLEQDFGNNHLVTLNVLIDKLSDEIIARLSELAEVKIGRLTFHFAHIKLKKFQNEVNEFSRFIKKKPLP